MESMVELERQLRAFGLVSAALGTKADASEAIDAFTRLVEVEFLAFASHEPAINDVASDRRLKQLLAEMRLYANCPALHGRTIGAIGGGFSSGKSAFVNSLLDASAGVKLAEGVNPVTAIPSYVLRGTNAVIQGINNKGASFEIGADIYKEISHELLKKLPFLRDIVPYIIVNAPMNRDGLEKLCFIDTPGYNPSAVGQAESDPETAREYIKDASFLIWMVGLDTNGTIPQSDLEFLSRLGFGGTDERQLYVIASKAELKPLGDVEDILDVFVECLDDNGLNYAGITAYSARSRKVIATRGQELFEFLAGNNASREHYTHLIDSLCTVFRPYVEEIYRDDTEKLHFRAAINSLLFEALRTGSIDAQFDDSKLEQGLQELQWKITRSEKLSLRLERVGGLFGRFKACVDDFAVEVGMSTADVSMQCESLFETPWLDDALGDVTQSRGNLKKKDAGGGQVSGCRALNMPKAAVKKASAKKGVKKFAAKKARPAAKKPAAKSSASAALTLFKAVESAMKIVAKKPAAKKARAVVKKPAAKKAASKALRQPPVPMI